MEKNIPMANLSLKVLLDECLLDKNKKEEVFIDFCMRSREHLHQIFKYRKFEYDFTDYLTCYSDGEHVVGYIRASYDEFLNNTLRLLNIMRDPSMKDDEQLTRKMKSRIEVLKNIKSERELQVEFPFLYGDLIRGRNYIRNVKKLPKDTEEQFEEYERQRNYYYSCALKQNLGRFIETQVELYSRFTDLRKDYKDFIESRNYNRQVKNSFNLDKVKMYVIDRYLKICEDIPKEKVWEKYSPLIEKYLNEEHKSTYIITNDEGRKISLKDFRNRYERLKQQHKNDKVIYTEWELVPQGKDDKKYHKGSHSIRTISIQEEELEALRERGEQKNAFYENTSYIAKVIGLMKYKGYVAYLYENGEIILDREYDKEYPRTARGDAIYHMNVENFEKLSKLDKTYLRSLPSVKRITHHGNWQEKVDSVLSIEATEQSKEEVKSLIKKLKKESD